MTGQPLVAVAPLLSRFTDSFPSKDSMRVVRRKSFLNLLLYLPWNKNKVALKEKLQIIFLHGQNRSKNSF